MAHAGLMTPSPSDPSPPIDRRPGRRGVAALAGSAALHAVLAALLLSRSPAPARTPDDVLSFDLLPATAGGATPPGPEAAPPSPEPRESRRRTDPASRARPSRQTRAPETRPADQEAASDSVAERPAAGPLALLPTEDQLARAGVSLAGRLPPATAEPGIKAPSRWQQGLADLRRREAGRAAIEARKAPPETFDVLRDLEKIYAPSQELILALVKKHAGNRRNVDRWLGRYLQGFGSKPEQHPGERFDPKAPFNRGVDKAALQWDARVCATFRPGADPTVEVDQSSGVRALDDIAVQAVTRAAYRRVGQVPRTRACYLFNATLTRLPPVPTIGCLIGAHGLTCMYPLKEIASTRVTLDGIEPVDPVPTIATPASLTPE